jgi:ABC-type transporter Mla MlaB component
MNEAGDLRSAEGPGLKFEFVKPDSSALILRLFGTWKIGNQLPSFNEFADELKKDPSIKTISLDSGGLDRWDSGLIAYLLKIANYCEQKQIELITEACLKGSLVF